MFHSWSCLKMWLLVSVALFVRSCISDASQTKAPDKSCPDTCGNIQIPYPFGIGNSCSLSDGFKLSCNISNPNDHRLFAGDIEITTVDLDSAQLQALTPMSYMCYNTSGTTNYSEPPINLQTPYWISYEENIYIAVGCDTKGYIYDSKVIDYFGGCITWCKDNNVIVNDSCSGTSCCETSIPQGMKNYKLTFNSWSSHKDILDFNPCSYSFIVKKDYYKFRNSDLTYMDVNRKFPVVLDWAIGNLTCAEAQRNKTTYACVGENSYCHESSNGHGYVCKCSKGYRGNPYIGSGCQDIDECKEGIIKCKGDCVNTNGSYTCTCPVGTSGNAMGDGCVAENANDNGFSRWAKLGIGIGVGLPFLFIIASCTFWVFQNRKLQKLKEEFFRQNGGLFLQEKITGDPINTFRIFTMEEMEKATSKFDEERILGKGGNGVVYKGLLNDGRTVAIKKSMMVASSKTKEFANEMLILSKINHINVVKLVGCCLEVEVPMLAYEYIPNGTLFQHLHSKRQDKHNIPWDLRLKIGAESAKALSYLHSEASPPILHGDIKSSNILLSENFTAKVSDFGTSTFAPKDKSRFMTMVQGTYGYLDPEYFQTGELTDKSDVYSFGVVMLELLTGKTPIYTDHKNDQKYLVLEFILRMKEGRLVEMLDPGIKDANSGTSSNSFVEEINLVADVVMQCLSITGQERPTISHVSMVLEGLRNSDRHQWAQQNMEEMGSLLEMQQSLTSSNVNTDEYPEISTTDIETSSTGSGRWLLNSH